MSIQNLLDRLEGVKETGHGGDVARCPAHDDRSPSLAIRETTDGRILVHDFAGCETEAVLGAVGLEFKDIMPERIGNERQYGNRYRPLKKVLTPFDAKQLIQTLDHEAKIVYLIGCDFQERKSLDEDTLQRLALATQRIGTARDACSPAKVR